MALIKCPECGKEISDKASVCPSCGYPIHEQIEKEQSDSSQKTGVIVVNGVEINPIEIYKKKKKHKTNTMKEIMKLTGMSEDEARDAVNYALSLEKTEEFKGIYRYSAWSGKTEVRCPRCGSEDCSHYKETIPEKTKTRYTMNLNPLKPFTIVNKKEKVVSKEMTRNRFMCNKCGKIFD